MSTISSAFSKASVGIPLVIAGDPSTVIVSAIVSKPRSNSSNDQNDTNQEEVTDSASSAKNNQRDDSHSSNNQRDKASRKRQRGGAAAAAADNDAEDPERLARTLFIGNVSIKAKQEDLAKFIRRHLATKRDEEEEKEAEGGRGKTNKKSGNKPSSKKEEEKKNKQSAIGAGKEEEEKDTHDDDDDDDENGEKQTQDSGGGGGGGKHGRDIESIRFRNVPISAVPVAPGSTYKQMIKAAVAVGSIGTERIDNSSGSTDTTTTATTKKKGLPPAPSQSNPGGAHGRDTCNAYVVFFTVEAANMCLSLNGQLFEGKHLRVDRAAGKKAATTTTTTTTVGAGAASSSSVGGNEYNVHYDHKRSVFVGNLPFDAEEEEVRGAFANIVGGGHSSIESVRIVRDRMTHIGKGIAFVLFKDRLSVVDALGLHGTQLRRRELRVLRCSADGKPSTSFSAPSSSSSSSSSSRRPHQGSSDNRSRSQDPSKQQQQKRPRTAPSTATTSSSTTTVPTIAYGGSNSHKQKKAALPAHMGTKGESKVEAKVGDRKPVRGLPLPKSASSGGKQHNHAKKKPQGAGAK